MSVEPYDDPEISDADDVVRRVNPVEHVVPDQNSGGRRLSTKAFSESSSGSQGMSVDLPKMIEEAGVDVETFVTTPVYTGSVKIRARSIRDQDLSVGKEPLIENPYHGEVWRIGAARRFTNGQKKRLRESACWFVEIEGVNVA